MVRNRLAPALTFRGPFRGLQTSIGSRQLGPAWATEAHNVLIADGAIAPWSGRRVPRYYRSLLDALANHYEISLDTPWRELPKRARHGILSGGSREEVPFEIGRGSAKQAVKRRWDGVLGELERRRSSGDASKHENLSRYCAPKPCPDCAGSRLRIEARSIRVGGVSISELTQRSVRDVARFFEELELSTGDRTIAERIVAEIGDRLRFLADVGLSYLTLERGSMTLSGGESQRIRLATQVGSRLMGVLYILDEPSVGLHPRDNERLLATLRRLRDANNSVIVVEHDEATIRAADFVIDMGPGAGIHGGEIVTVGTPAEIAASEASLTGAYLSGRRSIGIPTRRRPPGESSLVL